LDIAHCSRRYKIKPLHFLLIMSHGGGEYNSDKMRPF
jgi:hypothetical protein